MGGVVRKALAGKPPEKGAKGGPDNLEGTATNFPKNNPQIQGQTDQAVVKRGTILEPVP